VQVRNTPRNRGFFLYNKHEIEKKKKRKERKENKSQRRRQTSLSSNDVGVAENNNGRGLSSRVLAWRESNLQLRAFLAQSSSILRKAKGLVGEKWAVREMMGFETFWGGFCEDELWWPFESLPFFSLTHLTFGREGCTCASSSTPIPFQVSAQPISSTKKKVFKV
jgi:hypothetical protein